MPRRVRQTSKTASHDQDLPRHKRLTPGEVITDLRAWARKNGPLNYTALMDSDPSLCWAVQRNFGSVGRAAGRLGLRYQRRGRKSKWTKERIIEVLARRLRNRQPLSAKRVKGDKGGLYQAAFRYWDSWNAALAAAGVGYRDHRLPHVRRTRKEVIVELRAWARKNGPLNYTALMDSDPSLCWAVNWIFGSVRRAARRLGLRYQRRGRKSKWTKERIFEVLLTRLRGRRSLSTRLVVAEEGGLYFAAVRRWGSWAHARAAAERAFRSGRHGGDTR